MRILQFPVAWAGLVGQGVRAIVLRDFFLHVCWYRPSISSDHNFRDWFRILLPIPRGLWFEILIPCIQRSKIKQIKFDAVFPVKGGHDVFISTIFKSSVPKKFSFNMFKSSE